MQKPYFDITTSAITTQRKHCTEFVPFVTAQYITVKLTATVTKVFVPYFLTLYHLQYLVNMFKIQTIVGDSLYLHAHYNSINGGKQLKPHMTNSKVPLYIIFIF